MKTMDVNYCNKAFCSDTIATQIEPVSELVNNNTMKLIDKYMKKENFNSDFKFKSYEEMENQECLTCKKTSNNKNDSDPISDASKDSDTLILYIDESDIDYNTSDDEEVKNVKEIENCNINFGEHRDNYKISSLQQICTNNDTFKSDGNILCEDYNSKIDRVHVFNCEDASKRPRIDQQLVNIKNAYTSLEIHDQKINLLHSSDSKENFKLPNTDQHLVNINREDPDVLKIFYDESDIDSDYKSDSDINEKNDKSTIMKSGSNENCIISNKKDIFDTDVLVISFNEITNTNDVANHNDDAKSELNSLNNSEIIHSIENTIPDYFEELKVNEVNSELNSLNNSEIIHNFENTTSDYNEKEQEDLMNTGWNKLKVNEVKSELNLINTSETNLSVENTIPDYYEEEKEDLINTEWNKIKALSTDEERYKQVSDCWQSPSVPDPNTDLTYYSFRKRLLCSKGEDINEKRPVKRPASSNLDDRDAKHARLCTYIADDRIKSIENERDVKIKKLKEEFDSKISERFKNHHSLEKRLEERHFKTYGTISNYEAINGAKLKRVRDQFGREIKNIEVKYKKQLKSLQNQYISRISSSYKKRKEIMQFCNFYKMSKTNSDGDPTLFTREQQLKLDEIENIYKQLDFFYNRK
ncbi:hypothetical protein HNY73_020026 [Argiope bruennichi]|uniref:Uncharacterized protein n=1 Tax=Argiope bruennichi TaxID=94029 RepID=A0A8T0E6B3_ARGBR|nr:hypothetical protein HNY73_020026 [Argiope bruennichi]